MIRTAKRGFFLFLAILLLYSIAVPVFAADGLANFRETNSYNQNQFTDVSTHDWFYSSVEAAYRLGLMNGRGEHEFTPQGNITLAESLAMSCRLHSIYHGGSGSFTQGTPWWRVYVDYAAENGIYIPEGYEDFSTVPAIRADFAMILASAFPAEALNAVNHVTSIPDVPAGAYFASSVLLLYNAGITDGVDSTLRFDPYANITRCAAAAILTRMAVEGSRIRIEDTGEQPEQRGGSLPTGGSAVENVYSFLIDICKREGIHDGQTYQYVYYDTETNSGTMTFSIIYDSEDDRIALQFSFSLKSQDSSKTSLLMLNPELTETYEGRFLYHKEDVDGSASFRIDAESFTETTETHLTNITNISDSLIPDSELINTKILTSMLRVLETRIFQGTEYSIADLGFSALYEYLHGDKDEGGIIISDELYDYLVQLVSSDGAVESGLHSTLIGRVRDGETGLTRHYTMRYNADAKRIDFIEYYEGGEGDEDGLTYVTVLRFPHGRTEPYLFFYITDEENTVQTMWRANVYPRTYVRGDTIQMKEPEANSGQGYSQEIATERASIGLTNILNVIKAEILDPNGFTFMDLGFISRDI